MFVEQWPFNVLEDFFVDLALYLDGVGVDNINEADSKLNNPDFHINKVEPIIFQLDHATPTCTDDYLMSAWVGVSMEIKFLVTSSVIDLYRDMSS